MLDIALIPVKRDSGEFYLQTQTRPDKASPRPAPSLQLARHNHPQLHRPLGERRALLVLWQLGEAEVVEQRAQVRLDGVDAEEYLVGDLLVAGGRGVRVGLARTAKREEQ